MADVGAPSPIWQQGEVTVTTNPLLTIPSLVTAIVAVPEPTAVRTALYPDAATVTTRLFEVVQLTERPVAGWPWVSWSVTDTFKVWPPCKLTAPSGLRST